MSRSCFQLRQTCCLLHCHSYLLKLGLKTFKEFGTCVLTRPATYTARTRLGGVWDESGVPLDKCEEYLSEHCERVGGDKRERDKVSHGLSFEEETSDNDN